MNNPTIRLNKFLAERLGVSRREADDLISSGRVFVDGQPAILGARIDKTNKVCYNKKTIPFATDYLYLAFHKPIGYVCSRKAQGSTPTLYQLLPTKYQKLKTVGRLDKDSSGLILLTNDGDFAYRMTHPKFRKAKVYEVELDKPLEPLHQQMISEYGVVLDDGPSKFKVLKSANINSANSNLKSKDRINTDPVDHSANLDSMGSVLSSGSANSESRSVGSDSMNPASSSDTANLPSSYTVILTEGRNRQIRRTFAALGYTVTKLHRTQFGPYSLGDLKPGTYQNFSI